LRPDGAVQPTDIGYVVELGIGFGALFSTILFTISEPSLRWMHLKVLIAVTMAVPGGGGMVTVAVAGTKLVDHDGTDPRGQIIGGTGVTSVTVQLVPTGMLLIVCDPPSLSGNVAPPQLTVN
jgi:hypothetical protein